MSPLTWEDAARHLGELMAQENKREQVPADSTPSEWLAHNMKLMGEMIPREMFSRAVAAWREQLGLKP